jgi:hypothetical protein
LHATINVQLCKQNYQNATLAVCTADDDIVSVKVVELPDGIQSLHDGANATEQLLLRPICPRDIGTGWSTEG